MAPQMPREPRVGLTRAALCALLLQCLPFGGTAQTSSSPHATQNFGPYNVTFLESGVGESRGCTPCFLSPWRLVR